MKKIPRVTILHVTDLHFYKSYYQWILAQSGSFDVLCITGDLIGEMCPSSRTNRFQQINWVSDWLEKLTVPTFICSGNHDVDDEIDDDLPDLSELISDAGCCQPVDESLWLNKIKNPLVFTDNCIHTIGNITFGCVPYYGYGLDEYYNCDVLLHHDPPDNSKTCIQAGCSFGSLELYQALIMGTIAPSYVLCGHVHRPLVNEDKINNSFVSNPGASFDGDRPNHKYVTV